MAAWLAAATAGGQRYAVQVFNTLERVALDWVAQLCGIPAAHQGVLSSGGSTANLVALGAARQWAFERRGLDVSQDGLPPGARARIYASEQAHHTIQRATAVLGWAVPGPGTSRVTPGSGSMLRRCGPRSPKMSVTAWSRWRWWAQPALPTPGRLTRWAT